jgi:hypothetical protein
VEISGIAPIANGLWIFQIAPNLTDPVDEFSKALAA